MKVLLVVIDGAAPRVFCPAVKTGRLPTMQKLAEAGCMHEASVSIFPSITPAATTSIITGCYPAEHGIEGAAWFQAPTGEIAYYGDDFWVIAREGVGAFINDFLPRLNGRHLRAPTLLELVERAGRRRGPRRRFVAWIAPCARFAEPRDCRRRRITRVAARAHALD